MAVLTVAKIQHRRGIKADLPLSLYEGELGFCLDTRELFIGNSAASGGNTQILTNNAQVSQVIPYEFVSDTSVVSQTGSSMNDPVVRTLQKQIDDAWVNVKAYGAAGDGISDDTEAINRAIQDLYTKTLTAAENILQARKAIWFPSGKYVITQQLKLYPYVRLVGEHADTTVIEMTSPTLDSVISAVDSLGQSTANIGNNGATPPQYIDVCGLTFSTTGDQNILMLQRANHVRFQDCVFRGNWSPGDDIPDPAPIAVVLEKLGGAIVTEYFEFVNCRFQNIPWAFNCEQEVSYITFDKCEFRELHLGIRSDNAADETGPVYVSASNCIFDNIESLAISWLSSQSTAGPGIATNACRFVNVGYDDTPAYCIAWGPYSNLCSSIGDVFDLVNADEAVWDQGYPNLIVDAQGNNITNSVALVNVATTPYNVGLTDHVIVARPTTAGAAITINLPYPAVNGRIVTIKDGEGGAATYNINLAPGSFAAIETGNNNVPYTINTNWQNVRVCYNTVLSKWLII